MMQGTTFVDNFLRLPLRSCDIILGLKFQKLTLGFIYQGQKVLLLVNKETTRVVNAKELDKMTQNGGGIFMIRVFTQKNQQ